MVRRDLDKQMIGPLTTSDAAYIAVVLGAAVLSYLYKHVLSSWVRAGRRWFSQDALLALAAHIKSHETDEPQSERALENIHEALNLETRQRIKEDERLEKERSEQPT